jgi:large subunit ribosomal protein L6
MSRIAKMPVKLPQGVNATIAADAVTVKGSKGALTLKLGDGVTVAQKDQELVVSVADGKTTNERVAAAGAARANLANMVTGVTRGFERKLELVGVGYRAAVQGKSLNLTLGFSHPVSFPVPDGIAIETPSQTEIVVKGTDRQKVGQVAAVIRGYRPPEPYKGKGVRYAGEKMLQGFAALRQHFGNTSFSPAEREAIALAVHHNTVCDYGMALHSTVARRVGMAEEDLAALRHGECPKDTRLAAVSQFACEVASRRGRIDAAHVDAFCAAGFTREQALEALLGVTMALMASTVHYATRAEVDAPFQAQRWPDESAAA